MENASKALIMAGSVLIGVLIISIGVYLFSTYAQYSADSYAKMEASQIDEFNAQFLKYYGMTSYINEDGKAITERIKCTAHDVITLANLAQQSNKYYQVYNLEGFDKNTVYIQVDLDKKEKNLEKWNNDEKIEFIQKSTEIVEIVQSDGSKKKEAKNKYYYIADPEVGKPLISDITKRICYIKFMELKE